MTITIHASAETDRRQRGLALGERFAADVAAGWEGYSRLFDDCGISREEVGTIGRRTLDVVGEWAPDLAEEIIGIAEGAGLEPWQGAALNARTEILARYRPATVGECSTAVYLPIGELPRTLQTWDWYAHLRNVKLLWQLRTEAGRRVTTFTEFGVLGKIGVNDAGLGLHFNLLQHEQDGEELGVPVHLVARRILEEAADLAAAEAIVRSARVSASTAITVVASTFDDSGARRSGATTFELSPAGLGIQHIEDGGQLLHTNHFLDPELAKGERLTPVDPDTNFRHDEMVRRQEALQDPSLAARAEALHVHREDGAALCCHPVPDSPLGEQWETLLVAGLDVDRGELICRDGGVCAPEQDAWIRL